MRRGEGFTLVEVLVALFLLSLGLLAVAPMFVTASRQNEGIADAGIVSSLAVDRMEQLRSAPYDAMDVGGSLLSNTTVAGRDYFDTSVAGYTVRWQISGGATPFGGKTIFVRAVSSDALTGVPKEVRLRSIRVGD